MPLALISAKTGTTTNNLFKLGHRANLLINHDKSTSLTIDTGG